MHFDEILRAVRRCLVRPTGRRPFDAQATDSWYRTTYSYGYLRALQANIHVASHLWKRLHGRGAFGDSASPFIEVSRVKASSILKLLLTRYISANQSFLTCWDSRINKHEKGQAIAFTAWRTPNLSFVLLARMGSFSNYSTAIKKFATATIMSLYFLKKIKFSAAVFSPQKPNVI
jgi:hypothetical protein